MIIDAHQHLWKYDPDSYKWITPEMKILRRNFLPLDLLRELQENHVDGSIAVQSIASETETSFLVTEADRHDFIRGVVGWLDLCSPYVAKRIEYYRDCTKFRGLRHLVQDETDDNFMLREDFCKGIAILSRYNLTFDLLIFPRQLAAAINLVKKFPKQKFVIDHLAKPAIRDRMLSPWDLQIREIAQFPNVYCKISGMVTQDDPQKWNPGNFQPYMETVLEAFGPRRLMFGSDWPVCLLAAEYDQVLSLVKNFIQRLSPTEQDNILSATAVDFYGL
jgi:L-fuconolactonase